MMLPFLFYSAFGAHYLYHIYLKRNLNVNLAIHFGGSIKLVEQGS
jgi:hypothetical protein